MINIKTETSLDQVLSQLKKGKGEPGNAPFKLLKTLQELPIEEFEKYLTWRPEGPTRIRIAHGKDFDLILSCWEKDHVGPIHDLFMNEGWIHPLHGRLREEKYRLNESGDLEKVASVILDNRSFSYMNQERTIHRYVNTFDHRSICLHLYSEPVNKWFEVHPDSGRFVEKELEFHSLTGW